MISAVTRSRKAVSKSIARAWLIFVMRCAVSLRSELAVRISSSPSICANRNGKPASGITVWQTMEMSSKPDQEREVRI